MKKKLISTILTITMLTALLPTAFAANTVTRAEWISQLVEAFSMTIEDDSNMPDNYFSDITETDSYYRDILLAVEFGVIDLEEGEAFNPNESATREFAARTLNFCLQFQLDEGAEYTYSEADSVTYPDDIQIAVNRNWFALSDGNFLPEQAVTSADASAMIKDAKAVIANDGIDENYNSTYEFADGTVVIPETTNVTIDSDYTVTITDYETNIAVGDTFVVYNSGYPIALNALSVDTSNNITVISAEKNNSAITSADAEGSIDIDLENFDANELSTYSITNTETSENEEMAIELYSISYDKGSKTLTASQKISVGSAAAGTVSVKLKNLKLSHKENKRNNSAEAVITADTTVTTEISFDFGSYAGIPSSITLGAVPIAGVGTVALEMEYSLTGGVSMSWDGALKAGFSYNNGDLRLVKSYTKKGFSFTAEAQVKAGLRLSAVVDLVVVKGSIYGTVGVKMSFKLNSFDSGTPKSCVTIKGYMYAQVGATASVLGQNIPIKPQDIFTESNSPVRVVYHYEDNVLVKGCTRGLNLKYTTSTSSGYFNPSPSYGQGSYGGNGETSEPVVIWEYKVENDGNATITKYKGNASAVAVPLKIDGYTVTKIGYEAFKNNKVLRSVTMPDSVVEINSNAFYGCVILSNLKLPPNITILGSYVFNGCTALTEIFIPKTLEECYENSYTHQGPFGGSSIITAEIENGMITVPYHMFAGASELKNVTIPDTVTTIDGSAFKGCASLETVKVPEYVTKIGSEAFSGCTKLSNFKLPPNITILGSYVFNGCTALTEIFIPKTLEECYENSYTHQGPFGGSSIITAEIENGMITVPYHMFAGASELKNVTIPNTVTTINTDAFQKCISLEKIKMPDYINEIGSSVFSDCTSLTIISIPDSVKSIGNYTFSGCVNLNKVKLPNMITRLPKSTFSGCSSLVDIELPQNITSIDSYAFYGCKMLNHIDLPCGLETISTYTFQDCTGLESIFIPPSCKTIGGSAFKNCKNLKSVDMQYGLERIDSQAFYECDALNNVSIPDSVTSFGSQAFYGCDSLSDISFGIGLKEIPDSAFRQCQALQEVILPRYCTKVAANAFADDTKLTKVTALSSMANIENNSFSYPAKMTMRGVSGSYAQTYANNRNMIFEAINIPVTELNFYKDELDFSGTYQTKVLPLKIAPLDSTSDITYTSADEKIATVENGVVKSVGYGTTTITAQSGSYKDTITINVLRSANSLSLDKTSLSLEVGDTVKLTATMSPSNATDKITWTTSNATVATVDNGTITAIGAGMATITATTTSGKTASCTVKVTGTFTVTATAGENGKISPSGTVSVRSNEKATFNILPDYGYVVKDVLINGTSVGAVESYTFSNLTDNATISAEFAKVDVVYENNIITISSEAALKDLKLIIATYDEDGRLTDCKVKTVTTTEGDNYTDTITATDNTKLMLWNELDTMRPAWCSK